MNFSLRRMTVRKDSFGGESDFFGQTIIRWYNQNKRDLPWRHTKDPYKVWLSEIILQQTRVQQGLPYYETFVKKFPTVHHLAKAKEDEVMKTWQGLGYYSRAGNLHHTAKFVSKKLKGKFPDERDEIKKLKGVGDYTAGAIASFAFNKPYPVVDGNVFRVLSRFFGIKTPIDSSEGKKEFTRKAEFLLDKKNPGLFNQAVMEFGALQCVPQNPVCGKCPLKENCKAYFKNLADVLPVKSRKGKIRTRYFNYLIFRKNGKILIRKRTGNDIWKNLYDFPMIETNKEMKPIPVLPKGKGENKLQVLPFGPKGLSSKGVLRRSPFGQCDLWRKPACGRQGFRMAVPSNSIKHILSHQIIFAKFWEVRGSPDKIMPENGYNDGSGIYVNDNQLNKFAFPRLIERYFEMPFKSLPLSFKLKTKLEKRSGEFNLHVPGTQLKTKKSWEE